MVLQTPQDYRPPAAVFWISLPFFLSFFLFLVFAKEKESTKGVLPQKGDSLPPLWHEYQRRGTVWRFLNSQWSLFTVTMNTTRRQGTDPQRACGNKASPVSCVNQVRLLRWHAENVTAVQQHPFRTLRRIRRFRGWKCSNSDERQRSPTDALMGPRIYARKFKSNVKQLTRNPFWFGAIIGWKGSFLYYSLLN